MGLTDFSTGVQAGLQQLIAQRLAAEQRAQALRQQQFENDRQLSADKRAQQQVYLQGRQLDLTGENNQMMRQIQLATLASQDEARKAADTAKTREDAMKGRETFTPNQLVDANAPSSPVNSWEQAGVSIGRAIPPIAARLYTSPEDTTGVQGPTPQGRMGYLLTPTTAQAKDLATQGDKSADNARAEKTLAETVRHNAAMEKNAANKPPALQLITTTAPDGTSVQQFVPKAAGATYAKPQPGTVENRLQSAQAVNQTGNDIIAKLSDPKYASVVGPVLGRSATLRDFIGNPPPEFSDLAGQIESYALANMGVHGMRSAQGAQEIAHLLDRKHTPQSLIATIQGLNNFSTHFLENAGRGNAVKAPSVSSGFVAMVAPDGRQLSVPSDKVAELEAAGAKRK
jgi:hypothetical protein